MINTVYAQEAATPVAKAGMLGSVGQFLPIIIIFAVFYFLLIRPQQKQQKAIRKMIADAKKGDEIVTNSGLHGKIIEVKDDFIMLQAANNVAFKMERNCILKIKNYAA